MSEQKYRLAIVILLTIFVMNFIIIGYRFAENGRYQQFDQRKNYVISPMPHTKSSDGELILDTRTGSVRKR